MIVYLVRHAIAEERGKSKLPDDERPLTAEGIAKMKVAARGLRALDVTLDLVLTSPLRRARETAAIVAKTLGGVPVEELSALAPGRSPVMVLRKLRRVSHHDAVALVGHRPEISELAAYLLTGSTAAGASLPFKKGAIARFEIDFAATRSRAVLEWLLQPRELRRLAPKEK